MIVSRMRNGQRCFGTIAAPQKSHHQKAVAIASQQAVGTVSRASESGLISDGGKQVSRRYGTYRDASFFQKVSKNKSYSKKINWLRITPI
jgi:hypothetical protein